MRFSKVMNEGSMMPDSLGDGNAQRRTKEAGKSGGWNACVGPLEKENGGGGDRGVSGGRYPTYPLMLLTSP
jgi:hypothetical protein